MIGRDYILDLVERAGEAVVAMLTGRASDEARPVEDDPARNFASEFGDIHPHLLRVDSASAALLLRHPARIRRYALLLIQREAAGASAAVDGAAGASAEADGAEVAEATARRALELLLAAEAREPRRELELFAALLACVERERLDPEALAALRALGLE